MGIVLWFDGIVIIQADIMYGVCGAGFFFL